MFRFRTAGRRRRSTPIACAGPPIYAEDVHLRGKDAAVYLGNTLNRGIIQAEGGELPQSKYWPDYSVLYPHSEAKCDQIMG